MLEATPEGEGLPVFRTKVIGRTKEQVVQGVREIVEGKIDLSKIPPDGLDMREREQKRKQKEALETIKLAQELSYNLKRIKMSRKLTKKHEKT